MGGEGGQLLLVNNRAARVLGLRYEAYNVLHQRSVQVYAKSHTTNLSPLMSCPSPILHWRGVCLAWLESKTEWSVSNFARFSRGESGGGECFDEVALNILTVSEKWQLWLPHA